ALCLELGEKRIMTHHLDRLAGMAVMQGHPERAARLYGACAAQLQEQGTRLPPSNQADHDRLIALVHRQLADAQFATCWAEGQALSMEQAVAYALEEGDSGRVSDSFPELSNSGWGDAERPARSR